jgi:hypothetical protein
MDMVLDKLLNYFFSIYVVVDKLVYDIFFFKGSLKKILFKNKIYINYSTLAYVCLELQFRRQKI